ncbi:hypothetical protein [Streptomyces sp. NPDC048425]
MGRLPAASVIGIRRTLRPRTCHRLRVAAGTAPAERVAGSVGA